MEEASNRMCIPILSLPRKCNTISFKVRIPSLWKFIFHQQFEGHILVPFSEQANRIACELVCDCEVIDGDRVHPQYYYYLSMIIAPYYVGILTTDWGKVVISTWQLRGNKVVMNIRFLARCCFVPFLQALHHTKKEYSNGCRALCLELFLDVGS